MAEHVDVVVVGGGLAGLSSALELRRGGLRVVVLEQSARLGGKAGTRTTPYGTFPTGPVSFNGRVASFWRLLKLLGLEDEAVRLHAASSARFIVRGGRLEAIRPNPMSVLTTGALSLADKFALAKDLLSTKRASVGEGDESLDAFLERRFGRAVVDHFFAAVFTGIFAGDLKQLSAAACMPALVAAEREYGSVLRGALGQMRNHEEGSRPGLYTFREGMGVIGERAASRLDARVACQVTSLERQGGRVHVVASQGGALHEFSAGSLVLAVEAFRAATLLKGLSPEASAVLATFRYAPLSLVQWAEANSGDSKLPLGFGYLTAPVEKCFALGTLFIGDLLSETPRRFSTFVGGGLEPGRASLSDAALVEGVREDVRKLAGGVAGTIAGVVRWPHAVFQPAPGHPAVLKQLAAALSGLPVLLAGSYLGGAAMKDAIGSGFAAADALLQQTNWARAHSISAEVRA